MSVGLAQTLQLAENEPTNLPSREQLAADLQRAESTLEANLSAPVQRELASLAKLQTETVSATERLARDTQATIAGLDRSAQAVDRLFAQYRRLGDFEKFMARAAEQADKVVVSLESSYKMLQE